MSQTKVLIIDDEKLLVKSTCMALKCYNFQVEGALDGGDGVNKAKDYMPDIILLDIMMPGMDGWETLQLIKNTQEIKEIPVIVFSAKEYSDGRSIAQENGAVDFIPKPFELDELVELLNKYVSN